MKKQFKKRISCRGFTVTELLAAVAVLVILAAVAVPGVIALQRRLHITKMDQYARQIFLASQNELTYMKSSGTLTSLESTVGKTQKLAAAPVDYPEGDETWSSLCYLNSSDEAAQYLILADRSLENATEKGGCFILELDGADGNVYSAFYSETALSYADVLELTTRSRSERMEKMIGYYSGGAGASAIGLPESFRPDVSVSNGEELRVNVVCPDLLVLADDPGGLLLSVTVEDEHDGRYVRTYEGGRAGSDGFSIVSGKAKVSLVLDSLAPENAFASVTGGALRAGDNLTITAVMTYTANTGTILTDLTYGGITARTNSLFAKREDAAGTDTLQVSCVRHLNNLRASKFTGYDGSGGAAIVQTRAISFDLSRWSELDDPYPASWTKNPLESFAPISNPSLLRGGTRYDGGQNAITGFRIAGTGDVGLFASVTGCTLENIRLEDFVLSAGERVGTLAGSVTDTSIVNCGAYLVSRDETVYHRYLGEAVMTAKVAACTVSGTGSAGGLIGSTFGTCAVAESFAAVNVTGSRYVGGMIGYHTGGEITGCYGSGDVSGSSYVGGLAGYAAGASVSGCYSTSDVSAESRGGGLLGGTGSGTVSASRAYGKVRKSDGTTDLTSSGGLSGVGGATFSGCMYLTQPNYNDQFSKVTGVTGTAYKDADLATGNDPESSYPYDVAIAGNAFPFTLLTRSVSGEDQAMPHYGDWPARFQLQTSLVYYEKYADGGYAYYAVTSLTSADESGGVNQWTLDTLRDEVCVEDGYALMTIYPLERFTCSLNSGTSETVTVSGSAGAGKAVLLEQDVSLTFTNATIAGNYMISNAKVYQLPFSLQVTGRSAATKFYDKLAVTGYATGKTVPVFENYVFYYCPDFAKNAVNPDVSAATTQYPTDPGGEAHPVYVRSARQLNLLGKTTYYWNEGNSGYDFVFKQETDIDFGVYTDGTGLYCGVAFDLMDTSESNPYRNLPIGQKGNTKAKQFQCVYDGLCHTITDYRCRTYQADAYQFTGLFGEVYNATLKNIVMVASDPEEKSGYVESNYADRVASDSSGTLRGGNTQNAGVGALVGLLYVDSASSESACTVSNCAVSGYTVTYDDTGVSAVSDAAVGGLVGYNMGSVSDSSALSCAVELKDSASTSKQVYLSGLVGCVARKGVITRAYAGTEFRTACTSASGVTVVYGGLTNFDANDLVWTDYGSSVTGSTYTQARTVTECYAMSKLGTEAKSGTFHAVASGGYLTLQNNYYLKDTAPQGVSVSTGVTGKTGVELSHLTLTSSGRASAANTHPWSASLQGKAYPYPAFVTRKNPTTGAVEAYVHYGDWWGNLPEDLTQNVYLVYYEEYGTTAGAAENAWGYYTVDKAGNVVGDSSSGYLLGNEGTIVSSGYGLLCKNRNFSVSLASGYYDAAQPDGSYDGAEALGSAALAEGVADGYDLYAFSANLRNGIDTTQGYGRSQSGITLRDTGGLARTVYVEPKFVMVSGDSACAAAQIRTDEQLRNLTSYNQPELTLLRQTHDIAASAATGGITVNTAYTYDGNGNEISGLKKPLFAANNGGTLKNIRLTEVAIDWSADGQKPNAAALCVSNQGIIRSSCAWGAVKSSGNAAGLVYTNSGSIDTSYANCAVTSTQGSAAGLVFTHYGTAVRDCYAAGTVAAPLGTASGFEGTSYCSSITRCYAVTAVSGGTTYGFTPAQSGGTLSDCYWLKGSSFNASVSTTLIGATGDLTVCRTTAALAGKLSALNQNGAASTWALDGTDGLHTALYTEENDLVYPYPYLVWQLDGSTQDSGLHYGSWPTVRSVSGRIGAAVVYDEKNNSGNWRKKYTISGVDLNLAEETTAAYTHASKGYAYSNAIMFDSAFYTEYAAGGWSVYYTYTSGGQTVRQALSITNATTQYSLQNGQASGMILKSLPTGVTPQSVIFSDGATEYIFQYASGTVTYQGTANG